MPSPHIGAEAITPVISATGRIQGNSAIPVYVYTSIPSDRRGLGMAAQPVVFITDSDLVENGGQYKLQGRLTALPVIQVSAGSRALGMPAIPVYDVTNKDWPPAFNPVVPPSGFPPVTTGLLLNLQADALALSDSDPVSTWADASGLHHDFTQAGVLRPIYRANSGNPYVEFASDTLGTNNWMLGTDFADNLGSFTIFSIAGPHPTITNVGPHLVTKLNDSQNDQGWGIDFQGGTDDLYIQDQGTVNYRNTYPNNQAFATDFHVYTYEVIDYTHTHAYDNGDNSNEFISSFGAVVSIANAEPLRLGAAGGSGSPSDQFFWAGLLKSLMIYSPVLSPADRATMEQALKTKWGIP